MANPLLPGLAWHEQEKLYTRLRQYNEGRPSYKETGAYLVVLPRPGHPNYTLWIYSPLPGRQSIFYLHELAPDATDSHGDRLRPHIVWFGEAVPMIEPAIHITEEADIFVVIGTSLNVYPAAGLLAYVRPQVPIYLIDPKEVRVPINRPVHVIQKGASEGVAELIKDLRNEA